MRLAGAYQAVEALDVEREAAVLRRSQHTDYLFLAWNGCCRLSTLPAVYEPDTPANLDWLACRGVTPWPVIALYLHADKAVEGLPWGSVTLLDQQAAVEDVRIFSALPESQRERHIRLLVKRYQRHVTVNANWKMSFFAGMGCHFLAVSMRWVCSLDYPLLVGLKPVKS